MTLLGVVVISPEALLIKLIDANQWTVLFWRGLLSSLVLAAFVTVHAKGRLTEPFRAIGRAGGAVAMLFAVSNTFFVAAITHTGTANVLVIVSIGPLITALLTWLFLGEKIGAATWWATIAVAISLTVIMMGAFEVGEAWGNAAALVAAMAFAAALIIVRKARLVRMIPAAALGQLGSAIVAVMFGISAPRGSDIAYLALLGGLLLPIASALIVLGPRRISAPDVSLITQVEVLLGPLWVWLVLDEAPSLRVLVCGLAILMTLVIHAFVVAAPKTTSLSRFP